MWSTHVIDSDCCWILISFTRSSLTPRDQLVVYLWTAKWDLAFFSSPLICSLYIFLCLIFPVTGRLCGQEELDGGHKSADEFPQIGPLRSIINGGTRFIQLLILEQGLCMSGQATEKLQCHHPPNNNPPEHQLPIHIIHSITTVSFNIMYVWMLDRWKTTGLIVLLSHIWITITKMYDSIHLFIWLQLSRWGPKSSQLKRN